MKWISKMFRRTTVSLFAVTICLFCLITLPGCASLPKDTLTQFSTIDALLSGAYDGQLSCQRALKYGNFGLGTFDKLDGEMVVLDGRVYQIKADGLVYIPSISITTPFAAISCFQADKTFRLPPGSNFKEAEEIINKAVPNTNIFCGIKIEGTFSQMTTRSVPAQTKPYPPLVEVTKNQPVFTMENISGTIVGFRCPAYVKGINVPGYHLHFLSDDLKQGGHILDFVLEKGVGEIDICHNYLLILPEEGEGIEQLDLSLDRSQELEKVEK